MAGEIPKGYQPTNVSDIIVNDSGEFFQVDDTGNIIGSAKQPDGYQAGMSVEPPAEQGPPTSYGSGGGMLGMAAHLLTSLIIAGPEDGHRVPVKTGGAGGAPRGDNPDRPGRAPKPAKFDPQSDLSPDDLALLEKLPTKWQANASKYFSAQATAEEKLIVAKADLEAGGKTTPADVERLERELARATAALTKFRETAEKYDANDPDSVAATARSLDQKVKMEDFVPKGMKVDDWVKVKGVEDKDRQYELQKKQVEVEDKKADAEMVKAKASERQNEIEDRKTDIAEDKAGSEKFNAYAQGAGGLAKAGTDIAATAINALQKDTEMANAVHMKNEELRTQKDMKREEMAFSKRKDIMNKDNLRYEAKESKYGQLMKDQLAASASQAVDTGSMMTHSKSEPKVDPQTGKQAVQTARGKDAEKKRQEAEQQKQIAAQQRQANSEGKYA